MDQFVKHHYRQEIRFHRFRTHCFSQYSNKLVLILLDSNLLRVERLRKLFFYMHKIKSQHEESYNLAAYVDYRLFIFFTSKTPDKDLVKQIRNPYYSNDLYQPDYRKLNGR